MTMNLAFDSLTPRASGCGARLAVPRSVIARAMRAVEPHVDEAPGRVTARRARLDDVLCSLAATAFLVAVALPLTVLVSRLA